MIFSTPRRGRVTALAATALLTVAATAAADWREPVGGASPINLAASKSAGNLSLTTVGGVPFVAWNEDSTQSGQGNSSQIHVSRLASDGTSWLRVGDSGTHPISNLASTSSDDPSLADVGGTPWVAWDEYFTQGDREIRVAKLNADGTSWSQPVGGAHPINHLRADPGGNAAQPTLINGPQDRPYVSFYESDPGSGSMFFGSSNSPAAIYVQRLNAAGDGWDAVGGGPVNPDSAHDAAFPRMTLINGKPYVVFFQVALISGSPALQIDVARLSDDGQSWVQLPPVASGSPQSIDQPSITSINGVPYVAFASGGGPAHVNVYALNSAGTGWDLVGGGSADGASSSAQARKVTLTHVGGTPWVSWNEQGNNTGITRTARLVGGAWQRVGTAATADAQIQPSLASINGFPWLGLAVSDGSVPSGNNSNGCCDQVRVTRLEPTFQSSSAQPADTSATVLTGLQTYGLPYPVGFRYGIGALDHQSAATPVSGESPAPFVSLTGLTPFSLYDYAPYATAGTPLPLATGDTQHFVTQPAQPTPAAGSGPMGPSGPAGPMGPSGAPGPAGPMGPAAELVASLRTVTGNLHKGDWLHVRYVLSHTAQVQLRLIRGTHRVATLRGTGKAGRNAVAWNGRVAGRLIPAGRYRVELVAVSGTRSDVDRVLVTIR